MTDGTYKFLFSLIKRKAKRSCFSKKKNYINVVYSWFYPFRYTKYAIPSVNLLKTIMSRKTKIHIEVPSQKKSYVIYSWRQFKQRCFTIIIKYRINSKVFEEKNDGKNSVSNNMYKTVTFKGASFLSFYNLHNYNKQN